MKGATVILGVDLAWGHRQPDAVARIEVREGEASFTRWEYLSGARALLDLVAEERAHEQVERVILAIDAPTLCINEGGSRPVDKECTARYRKFEAGCHPVNLSLVERPLRLAAQLKEEGMELSCDLESDRDLAMEVYPHPAMINWFELDRTIKYKRGRVEDKRREFARYQRLFAEFLGEEFPSLHLPDDLVKEAWTKRREDLLDAHLCALIGFWHWKFGGRRSQILGDSVTGQMLIPVLSRMEDG